MLRPDKIIVELQETAYFLEDLIEKVCDKNTQKEFKLQVRAIDDACSILNNLKETK